jgi:hypothetical protein
VTAFGAPTSIRLTWNRSASADARGYDIQRATSPGGPFTRINAYTVDGTAAFEDHGLPPLTRYYYRVVTRDSSYNASPVSLVISGTTNPPATPGWPIELAQQTQSSLVLSNTAGGSDYEVFTAADMQYGWHANGAAIVDGDDDDRTNGLSPSTARQDPGATPPPAGNSIERRLEVLTRLLGRFLYVEHQGQSCGWPKSVLDDSTGLDVLADLTDGDLESCAGRPAGGSSPGITTGWRWSTAT